MSIYISIICLLCQYIYKYREREIERDTERRERKVLTEFTVPKDVFLFVTYRGNE